MRNKNYQGQYVGNLGDIDLGADIVLCSLSQDRKAIEDYLDLPEGEYSCYFVQIGEGDYSKVYGASSARLGAALFDLSANIP